MVTESHMCLVGLRFQGRKMYKRTQSYTYNLQEALLIRENNFRLILTVNYSEIQTGFFIFKLCWESRYLCALGINQITIRLESDSIMKGKKGFLLYKCYISCMSFIIVIIFVSTYILLFVVGPCN